VGKKKTKKQNQSKHKKQTREPKPEQKIKKQPKKQINNKIIPKTGEIPVCLSFLVIFVCYFSPGDSSSQFGESHWPHWVIVCWVIGEPRFWG
jgi:hypothetical protein